MVWCTILHSAVPGDPGRGSRADREPEWRRGCYALSADATWTASAQAGVDSGRGPHSSGVGYLAQGGKLTPMLLPYRNATAATRAQLSAVFQQNGREWAEAHPLFHRAQVHDTYVTGDRAQVPRTAKRI